MDAAVVELDALADAVGTAAEVAADGVTLVNTAGAASASSQHYVTVAGTNLTAGGGWQRFTGYLKGYAGAGVNGSSNPATSPTAPGVLHANARYITPIFFANFSGGTGTAEIGMVTVEVVETGAVQTVNIADGAITTQKMIANTIQGDRIAADTLNADKIVGNSITASQLAALSVTASQMAANSVTATAIAAGVIDATHIKAGAITADRLAITGGSNMLPDPSFEGAGGAALVVGQTFWSVANTGNGSAKSLQVNAVNATAVIRTLLVATVPVLAGQQFRLSTDVNPSTDWNGASVRMYARWIDSAGGVTFGFVTNTAPTKGSWTNLAGTVTVPAGTVTAEIRLASYDASLGTVLFDNAAIQPLVSDVLIADGAITADKINADAINGKTITGATVQSAANGRRVALTSDGNIRFYTGLVGEEAAGFVTVDGALKRMSLSSPQFNIHRSTIDLEVVGFATYANFNADLVQMAGVLSAGNIRAGRVSITPTAANTPKSITITGLAMYGGTPRGIATPSTTVPGTEVTGVGVTSLTTDSATIWVTRTNTTTTHIDYFIFGA